MPWEAETVVFLVGDLTRLHSEFKANLSEDENGNIKG